MNTDIPRSGRGYVLAVIACGVAVVINSLVELVQAPVHHNWFILAGLTLLSGSFTIRIPTIPARLSVSETFVFATVLLYGPAAATIIVVLDSLIISLWLRPTARRAERVLFNMAAPAVAIWLASHFFFEFARVQPLSEAPQEILALVLPLFALALCYFILNSVMIAIAVAFERRVTAIKIWKQNFLWLSLNYFSGASVAALLLPYLQAPDSQFISVIGVILPLLLISYLTFKTALGRVEDANTHLRELNRLYLSTIETLAMAIDAKDQITHGHIRRVQSYAVKLATAMGITDPLQIQAVEAAALLHDMGKLAVPEHILNKPGPLTPAEFDRMKLHASVGADILSAIEFPYPVVPIVRHHHENWDGTGYPAGLSGSDIPIGARILSVVDCFDALTSDRPYRPRLSDEDALRILLARRANMYDPLVVDTFIRIHAESASQNDDDVDQVMALGPITQLVRPAEQRRAVARPLEEIAASRAETLVLLEMNQALTASETAQQVSAVALQAVKRLIPASVAVVFSRAESSDDLIVLDALGESPRGLNDLRIKLGHSLSGWVGANRQSIRNSDPALDLGASATASSPALASTLSTPVVVGAELVAVITLYSGATNAFSADHERILEGVAGCISRPLQTALTRSRRDRFGSGGMATALMLISVTKQTEEPSAQWLSSQRALEQMLKASIRSSDVVVDREPGVFIVAMRDVEAADIQELRDRLDNTLNSWLRAQPAGTEASTGFAAGPADGDTQEDLERVAQARASAPKSSGRISSQRESIH